MAEAFPAELRLRKRCEFLEVQRHGKRLPSDAFVVLALARPGLPARVGITVSKKVGGAVVRNRIKRIVREAIRRNRALLPEGYEIVIVARRESADLEYERAATELGRALARLGRAGRPG
ncbi:MAG: ribonuclease P protein component [Deltaproteobacteria bacterium]|nr:ribonuclease P protein component [Deltaproteobacteria bacterium]